MTPEERIAQLQQQDCEEECPWSHQRILLRRWEWYLFNLVWDLLIEYKEARFRWRRPPPPVLCVDAAGRPHMEGFAFGFRWAREARQIEIAVAASPRAQYVRWWPLGRVLWVVGDEIDNVDDQAG